jgi:Fe-S-cluster formation regulator IscX/YfhJ
MMFLTLRNPLTFAEMDLLVNLKNLAAYLNGTDPSTINFVKVREQLVALERDRDALVHRQGGR